MHELGYACGDLGWCPAGGVDDRQVEGAVMTTVGDGGLDVAWPAIGDQASAPFLILAVEQNPGADGPVAELAGSAHAEEHGRPGLQDAEDCTDQVLICRPGVGFCRIGRPASAAAGTIRASQSRMACPGSNAVSGRTAPLLPDPGAPSTPVITRATVPGSQDAADAVTSRRSAGVKAADKAHS
jgi:hypothetical protein